MAVTFNPFTGNLDFIDTTAAAGSDTEIQYNDNGKLAGDADLTWDTSGATSVLGVGGDINLDDGGTYETTLQVVTPTANRTISFPDATGTVGLVAGSSTAGSYHSLWGGFLGAVPFVQDGALTVSNGIGYDEVNGILSVRGGFTTNGAVSSIATLTGNTTFTGRIINSVANAASAPAGSFTGTWFTTGTSTTTKPALLVEQSGATSTGWNATGTGFGVNSASTFAGRLLDLQKNGTTVFNVEHTGNLQAKGDLNLDDGGSFTTTLQTVTATANRTISFPDATGTVGLVSGSTGQLIFNDAGAYAGVSTATVSSGNITLTGRLINSTAGALSASPVRLDGTWLVSGGANNTTFPQFYISPSGASTGTSWSTAGTGLGINAPASFTGDLIHLLINGTTEWKLSNSAFTIGDANDIAVGSTTGTKIGTATTQKLAFYNATPVVQPTAVADITTVATVGTLPTPDGSVTIADATTPTVTELLEYCVELESKLEAALGHLRTLGLIAT